MALCATLKNSRYLRWEFKCGTWHSNMYMISSTYFQVFRMLLDKNYPGAVCRSDYTQLFLQLSHNSSLSSQLSFDTGILRTKPNSMRTVLAVDVGGTYTRLSLVEISRPWRNLSIMRSSQKWDPSNLIYHPMCYVNISETKSSISTKKRNAKPPIAEWNLTITTWYNNKIVGGREEGSWLCGEDKSLGW